MKYLTRPCSGKVCIAIESYGTEAIQHPQFRAAFPWRGGTQVRTNHFHGNSIRRMQRRMRVVVLHVQQLSDARMYKSSCVNNTIYKQQCLALFPDGAMHDRLMEEHCERSCRHCKYVSNALQARSDLLLEKTVRNSDESEVVPESQIIDMPIVLCRCHQEDVVELIALCIH